MTDPESTRPSPPPIVQISPTEMAGAWPEEVRGKLEQQGLAPEVAARLAGEVARLSETLRGEPDRHRTAARIHLLLGLMVLASALASAIMNYLLHAYALVYLGAGAAAVWGVILMRRGWMQWRLSCRSRSRACCNKPGS